MYIYKRDNRRALMRTSCCGRTWGAPLRPSAPRPSAWPPLPNFRLLNISKSDFAVGIKAGSKERKAPLIAYQQWPCYLFAPFDISYLRQKRTEHDNCGQCRLFSISSPLPPPPPYSPLNRTSCLRRNVRPSSVVRRINDGQLSSGGWLSWTAGCWFSFSSFIICENVCVCSSVHVKNVKSQEKIHPLFSLNRIHNNVPRSEGQRGEGEQEQRKTGHTTHVYVGRCPCDLLLKIKQRVDCRCAI